MDGRIYVRDERFPFDLFGAMESEEQVKIEDATHLYDIQNWLNAYMHELIPKASLMLQDDWEDLVRHVKDLEVKMRTLQKDHGVEMNTLYRKIVLGETS